MIELLSTLRTSMSPTTRAGRIEYPMMATWFEVRSVYFTDGSIVNFPFGESTPVCSSIVRISSVGPR